MYHLPKQRSMRRRQLATAGLFLALVPVLAGAQSSQYQEPGTQAERSRENQEQLDRAIREARWSLGSVKLDPWVGLRDAAWIDQVSSAGGEGDFSVTAGVGLRAFVPLGRTTLTLWALPEYVWWRRLEDRRGTAGRFGAGWFAYLSRATVEATAESSESQLIVTPESRSRVPQRVATSRLLVAVQLYRSLEAFGQAEEQAFSHQTPADLQAGPAFESLDRTERDLRLGLRMRLGAHLRMGLGLESQEVDFDRHALVAIEPAASPFLDLRYEGARTFFESRWLRRRIEPSGFSGFPAIDENLGTVLASLNSSDQRRSIQLYGRRNLIYALLQGSSLSIEEIVGTGATWAFTQRLDGRVFYERGTLEDAGRLTDGPRSSQDLEAYGGDIGVKLPAKMSLAIVFTSRRLGAADGFTGPERQLGIRFNLGSLDWP